MTLLRCFLLTCCITFAGVSLAQESAPSLEGRKARLALLSQISSKSPTRSSFMAKVEDPVEVDGKPMLPKEHW